jgi:hypothetical protein
MAKMSKAKLGAMGKKNHDRSQKNKKKQSW